MCVCVCVQGVARTLSASLDGSGLPPIPVAPMLVRWALYLRCESGQVPASACTYLWVPSYFAWIQKPLVTQPCHERPVVRASAWVYVLGLCLGMRILGQASPVHILVRVMCVYRYTSQGTDTLVSASPRIMRHTRTFAVGGDRSAHAGTRNRTSPGSPEVHFTKRSYSLPVHGSMIEVVSKH